MSPEIEEGRQLDLDFGKFRKVALTGAEVVPVVAQDVESGEVLIVGYANELALQTTLKKGRPRFGVRAGTSFGSKARPRVSSSKSSMSESTANRTPCSIGSAWRAPVPATPKNASGIARHGCYYRRVQRDGTLEFVDPPN